MMLSHDIVVHKDQQNQVAITKFPSEYQEGEATVSCWRRAQISMG